MATSCRILPSTFAVSTLRIVTSIFGPFTTSFEAYCVPFASSEQPASSALAGRSFFEAMNSDSEVLQAPARAFTSVTFERLM